MAELGLVVEETDAEFASLRLLIDHSEAETAGQFMLSGQARIVAANASVLYLAAAFEEGVRQLGHAYVDSLSTKTSIPTQTLEAIKVGLWEASSSALSTSQYGAKSFDRIAASNRIAILKDFCLDMNDINLMKDNAVYNNRNMRVKEVNSVFRRLGMEDICNKAGRSGEFKTFFLVDSVSKAQDQFILFLNSFYEMRNAATHELGVFRSQGSIDSRRFIDFFTLAIRRLAAVLQNELDRIS